MCAAEADAGFVEGAPVGRGVEVFAAETGPAVRGWEGLLVAGVVVGAGEDQDLAGVEEGGGAGVAEGLRDDVAVLVGALAGLVRFERDGWGERGAAGDVETVLRGLGGDQVGDAGVADFDEVALAGEFVVFLEVGFHGGEGAVAGVVLGGHAS